MSGLGSSRLVISAEEDQRVTYDGDDDDLDVCAARLCCGAPAALHSDVLQSGVMYTQ